jgi:hypothetical protein
MNSIPIFVILFAIGSVHGVVDKHTQNGGNGNGSQIHHNSKAGGTAATGNVGAGNNVTVSIDNYVKKNGKIIIAWKNQISILINSICANMFESINLFYTASLNVDSDARITGFSLGDSPCYFYLFFYMA